MMQMKCQWDAIARPIECWWDATEIKWHKMLMRFNINETLVNVRSWPSGFCEESGSISDRMLNQVTDLHTLTLNLCGYLLSDLVLHSPEFSLPVIRTHLSSHDLWSSIDGDWANSQPHWSNGGKNNDTVDKPFLLLIYLIQTSLRMSLRCIFSE